MSLRVSPFRLLWGDLELEAGVLKIWILRIWLGVGLLPISLVLIHSTQELGIEMFDRI
jgi:hypothetical protein